MNENEVASEGRVVFSQDECEANGWRPTVSQQSPMCMLIRDLIPHDVLQIRNPFDDDADSSQQNEEAVTVLEFLAGESVPFQECIIVVLKKRISVVSDMVLQSPSL